MRNMNAYSVASVRPAPTTHVAWRPAGEPLLFSDALRAVAFAAGPERDRRQDSGRVRVLRAGFPLSVRHPRLPGVWRRIRKMGLH